MTSNIIAGILFIVLGGIVIMTASVPLRQFGAGWLVVNEKAAFVIGVLVIISGIYSFYVGVRGWLKSRRS